MAISRSHSIFGGPPPQVCDEVLLGGGGGIRTHGTFRFTRFPSVPIRPLSHSSSLSVAELCCHSRSLTEPTRRPVRHGRISERTRSAPWVVWVPYLFWQVVVGSCATEACEPSQGRKAAALSGTLSVPQVAWPPLARTDRSASRGPLDPLVSCRRSSGSPTIGMHPCGSQPRRWCTPAPSRRSSGRCRTLATR